MNIYQRINAVMKDVSYVKKDAQVSGGGQNYSAVTHDQVVSMVRASMVKHGIVCYPEQIKGEMLIMRDVSKDIKMHLYAGEYKIHFVGIDEGDEVNVIVQAHANDNGDKAPGKCLTYAVKSAMLKIFNLESGVNDESREEERESKIKGITQEHLDELMQLVSKTGTDVNKFAAYMGKSKLHELFDSQFDEAKAL